MGLYSGLGLKWLFKAQNILFHVSFCNLLLTLPLWIYVWLQMEPMMFELNLGFHAQ
jgi:hypothetical protein